MAQDRVAGASGRTGGRSGRAAAGGDGPAAGESTQVGRLARGCRVAYGALAWILVVCVAAQVFLAGMAVFVDPLNWARHTNFVHVFELIPVLMLILAFPAKRPRDRGYYLRPVLLWALIGLQYALIDLGRIAAALAALHPVNALVIAWLAAQTAQREWPTRIERRKVRG